MPIVSETNGRVAEVFVKLSDNVEKGAPIFRLDDSQPRAALETARRRIAEVDAQMAAGPEPTSPPPKRQILQAKGAYQQALDELETKGNSTAAAQTSSPVVRSSVLRPGRRPGRAASMRRILTKQGVETRIATVLPAQKASAEAALAKAEAELARP